MKSRIPKAAIRLYIGSTTIHSLITSSTTELDYPWAKRMVGRFPMPEFQRQSVWTTEQDISFIESVFYGYDLGSVIINAYKYSNNGPKDTLAEFSDILIDGQQRVNALNRYIKNEFSVFGLFWKELTRIEKRDFRERPIGIRRCECYDEQLLKDLYNHHNFSGVKHKASERA